MLSTTLPWVFRGHVLPVVVPRPLLTLWAGELCIVHYALKLLFSEHDVDDDVHVTHIHFGVAVNIGAAGILAGLSLAQHDVDDDVHVAHIHLAVAIHIATKISGLAPANRYRVSPDAGGSP